MAGNKRKQRKSSKPSSMKKRKLATKPKKPELKMKIEKTKPEKTPIVPIAANSNEPDPDLSELDSERIQKLLEPYTKDQLIEFLIDAALTDPPLLDRIQSIADKDVSHRKIFVHGLAWNTTREILQAAFESYGEIEELHLVVDKNTGRAKGFGFILFKTRAEAAKALKEPRKNINNRITHCQLASAGPPPEQSQDTSGRKIYVSNVHADVDPEKLRTFFSKFGEIELGPLGFDMLTGKSRGFALFVYRTYDGAKKAIEEPYKMFEGHQLHCQRAIENKNKGGQGQHQQQQQQQQQQNVQPPMLAAVAAAQNLALFAHNPSLHPAYGGLMMNPNPGLVGGSANPFMMGAVNLGGVQSSQGLGGSIGTSAGLGGYSASHGMGMVGGNPSIYGAHSSIGSPFQGMPSYQTSNIGRPSSSRTGATGGSFTGYPSYM